ncbi:MAG: uroporphyrinogen-III C-methyltransferase [Gammaproteobacteria bacterium]|nr:uroporphyrinogen-III C-methyltransferase [Gammaproteobacteria bacterium]
MNSLPVFLRLQGRTCLVVGGGEVAARKVAQLLKAGGEVRVVAPELCPALQERASRRDIQHRAEEFSAEFLEGCVLAIAATDDRGINRRVSDLAQEHGIPVNVVDDPELCTFIMPSIVDRSPVVIAIASGGASPVLSRLLRARLETLIPSGFGRLAELMREFRARVREKFPVMKDRRRFWEQILEGPVAEMLYAGQDKVALAELEERLREEKPTVERHGEVYLVGGGPGDPDLLTFRALRLMQRAEVVLYDRLVAPAIVDLCRKDAERIYVGKERDRHAIPQEEVNEMLIKLAGEGKRVLRLKGGDPFIFGRGGEEIDRLSEAGIPFQVVPGITAAAGCAAYAGIPLTHRDYAHSCIFVTGHMKDGKLELNWDALVQPKQTIAVYMGVKGLDTLCEELIRHGMKKEMPAALVERGTTARQRVYVGTLATLPKLAGDHEIAAPSMAIIGEVVKLHEKLAWYDPAGGPRG